MVFPQQKCFKIESIFFFLEVWVQKRTEAQGPPCTLTIPSSPISSHYTFLRAAHLLDLMSWHQCTPKIYATWGYSGVIYPKSTDIFTMARVALAASSLLWWLREGWVCFSPWLGVQATMEGKAKWWWQLLRWWQLHKVAAHSTSWSRERWILHFSLLLFPL